MEENRNTEQEKREARRKKRKKAELVSYIIVFVAVMVLTAGGIFGGMFLYNNSKSSSEAQQAVAELEQVLEEEEEQQVVLSEPDPEPEVLMPSEDEIAEQVVRPIIDSMTLEEKVAQLFIVTPESITGVDTATMAGDGTKAAIEKYPVGGMIYFAKNIVDKDQLVDMLTKTASYSKYPMFLAVDEEGGDVARVANSKIEVQKTDTPEAIGATGDPNNAYVAGSVIASYLKELGFNLDMAPVADVKSVENSYVGTRAFGSDFNTVAGFVSAEVSGLQENGVSACLKHFPGLGSTTADTHEGMVASERSSQDFRDNEFLTFKAGIEAGTDFVMVSHMSLPTITGDNTPCCLTASVVTDLLRNELGYNGVVITDAMNMGAISEYYASDEAAVMALRAGCDIILMPENFEEAYNGVLTAISEGKIAEERVNDAVKRILSVKYKDQIEEELAKY